MYDSGYPGLFVASMLSFLQFWDLRWFCCCIVNCKTEFMERARLTNECATKGQKTWPWHESWSIM